jgi:hypothetical protein
MNSFWERRIKKKAGTKTTGGAGQFQNHRVQWVFMPTVSRRILLSNRFCSGGLVPPFY